MNIIPQWLADWMGSISLFDVLAFIVFVVVVIRFIARKGWRSVKTAAKGVMAADQILDAVKDLPADMSELKSSISDIRHEVYPNSGGSLRDQVDKINNHIGEVDRRLSVLEAERAAQ